MQTDLLATALLDHTGDSILAVVVLGNSYLWYLYSWKEEHLERYTYKRDLFKENLL